MLAGNGLRCVHLEHQCASVRLAGQQHVRAERVRQGLRFCVTKTVLAVETLPARIRCAAQRGGNRQALTHAASPFPHRRTEQGLPAQPPKTAVQHQTHAHFPSDFRTQYPIATD